MECESGLEFLSRIRATPVNDLSRELFSGLLNPPEIIEVMGLGGSGKSLLCMDLMAKALMPKTLFDVPIGGLESSVIFVDCDKHFNILHFADLMERKIKRICHKLRAEWKLLSEKKNEEIMTIKKKEFNEKIKNAIKESLKNVLYFNCADSNQFALILLSIEQSIEKIINVSLIIIDSISSFYWYDKVYRYDNWSKLEAYYNKILHSFIDIIKKHHLVCICTKQSLFQKRREKEEALPIVTCNNLSRVDENVYEFLGKEWFAAVTIRISLSQNFNQLRDLPTNENCDAKYMLEIVRGGKTKLFSCTFHEDGIRWIE